MDLRTHVSLIIGHQVDGEGVVRKRQVGFMEPLDVS